MVDFEVPMGLVAEMLQKSKFLLYVLYSCYIKFYFDYIFHNHVMCFLIYLIYIYRHMLLILLHISVSILFDFTFV